MKHSPFNKDVSKTYLVRNFVLCYAFVSRISPPLLSRCNKRLEELTPLQFLVGANCLSYNKLILRREQHCLWSCVDGLG